MSPTLTMSSSYSLSHPSQLTKTHATHTVFHSRTNSESFLFTPPLSPTEQQLLEFLIPDIEPSELAAYLSAPTTPVLSDVSCLIGQSPVLAEEHPMSSAYVNNLETVYPSPVCAAAAATVVALDRLDGGDVYPMLSTSPTSLQMDSMLHAKKKRCSTYAFLGSEDEENCDGSSDFSSSPVYVMSSRNSRKRLMLEQAFVSPDDEESCYAQIFQGTSSNDSTSDLSTTLAFDLVLV
ncbi:hypothetical protein BX616_000057 [Lobosporangium transversale]|nr:hypothetical protein BX616_000057 [Lobosporangium transversale]